MTDRWTFGFKCLDLVRASPVVNWQSSERTGQTTAAFGLGTAGRRTRGELLGPMLVGLVCFRVLRCWMLVALAVPAGAQVLRDPSPPSAYPQGSEAASLDSGPVSSQRPLTAFFRGQQLPYVVIDGMAVHAGDIVLGRVEDLVPRPPLAGSPKPRQPTLAIRRDLSPTRQKYLWPGGVVPYAIDSDVSAEQRQDIEEAVRSWNDKTVLSLVARSTESDYVRFSNVESGFCRSRVGMVGGEQKISIPPAGCSPDAVAHEIGHAVGLWHEHQREDRDDYVTLLYENLDTRRQHSYSAQHPALGHYDYASVMHYDLRSDAWNDAEVFETVPPGMQIPSAGLSAGDIDGVARLYGKIPVATSITTNPPGLEIVVDGVRHTAPATFEWIDGSNHILEAPLSQTVEGTRYLFGRWNDGGSRLRNVTAGSDLTWLESNFIVQHRVGTRAEPDGTGTVELRPSSPDGYYTLRTPVRAVPTPNPGSTHAFWQWDGTIWGRHGRASNPAEWRVDRPDKEFAAVFTDRPLFRIEADIDPFVVHINDYYDGAEEHWSYAPAALATDVADSSVELGIDEVGPAPYSRLRRHRFNNWSDGGARIHTLSLPPEGGSISAGIVSEYPLSTHVENPDAGTITLDPASGDAFYAEGASVRLAATPNAGWEFVGWRGDLASRESSTTIAMTRPMHAEAVFSQTQLLRSDQPVSVTLPSTNYRFIVHDEDSGYRVEPSSGSGEVRISFEGSTPGVEVDLLVQAGSERFVWHFGEDGRTPEFRADHQSTLPGSSEMVTLNATSTPPLDPSETYYIALVVFSPRTRIEGALTAEIERASSERPSAEATPRALTFVSPTDADPATQVIRLTNTTTNSFQYTIDPDRTWLSATPPTGTLAAGSTAEIEIGALSAGVWPDTHAGRLTVTASALDSQVLETLASVPVTFVVVPATGDDSSAEAPSVEQAVNRASGSAGAAPSANLVLNGSNMALGGGSAGSAALEGSEPLPTALQGASVMLKDSLGTARLAGLTHVRPDAISFIVPDQVSLGSGSVTVRRMDAASTAFSVEIASVAPGLFSANLNGSGPAWASAYRVAEDGGTSVHPITDFDAPVGNRTAIPVSLGNETDKVYLSLLGTGIRGWKQELRATIAEGNVEVSHAAPHPQGPGHDVIVLGPLPRSLDGIGEVEIVVIADGNSSNAVTVSIQ